MQEGTHMYLMIDNYDSFVYNLKAYFEELGRKILVRRSDQITMEEIEEMNPEGSSFPPGTEASVGCGLCVWRQSGDSGRIPILGAALDIRCLDSAAVRLSTRGASDAW